MEQQPHLKQFSYIYLRFLSHAGIRSFSDGNCVNFADDEESPESVFVEEECAPPSSFVSNITYICGFVVRNVMKREACEDCKLSLVRTDAPSASDGDYLFLTLKNNGELIVPSKEVINLLKIVESFFRLLPDKKKTEKIVLPRVLTSDSTTSLFTTDHHVFNDHRDRLLRSLTISYCKIRSFHISRNFNLSLETVRHKLTKIHFKSN